MKKNVIALLLSVVLAAGSVGAVPAWAAETTGEVWRGEEGQGYAVGSRRRCRGGRACS